MRNSLFALFAATFAGAAAAHTGLQPAGIHLYGLADAGVMWQKGGPTRIYSGGADGSRIGIKGSEDLGGGFQAIFNLEARVELDTGGQQPALINDNPGRYLLRGMDGIPQSVLERIQATVQPPGAPVVNQERAMFDRVCLAGLVTPLGAVLLGRMYTPGYEVLNMADVFESGTAGTWGHVLGGVAGYTALGLDVRSQEAIQYRVALPNGLGGSVMAGREGSGFLGRYGKFHGGALTYKTRAVEIGAGYNQGYDRQYRRSLRTVTVGGSYTVDGRWKLFAGWHSQRNDNSALLPDYLGGWDGLVAPALAAQGMPAATGAALRRIFASAIAVNTRQHARSWQLGLHYRLGAGRLMASYANQDDRMATDSDARQIALGYDHFMSPRTDLYTVAAFIRNRNEAQYSPGTSGNPGGFSAAPGVDGRALQLGIRHRF